ncbi:zinc finger protein 561-like isoform X2 [Watersipora subatra]|uniref:zinc finger protein 561-like isoform X2 n=1 Tax=Watersipora subatra TaxID=2589382 RepID=UPI00355C07CA
MEVFISNRQKDLLMKAVGTGNAQFIAECIINIEEIISCIKKLLILNVCDNEGLWKNTLPSQHLEKEIKQEPLGLEPMLKPSTHLFESIGGEVSLQPSPTQGTSKLNDESSQSSSVSQNRDGSVSSLGSTDVRKPHRCEKCKYSSHRKYRLEDHMRRIHGSEQDDSPGTITTPSSRSEVIDTRIFNTSHADLHFESEPTENTTETISRSERRAKALTCTGQGCNYIADNKADLKKHMLSQHPSLCETIRCEHCDFSTKKRANYRQHLKTHLAPGDKPYKCNQCSYSSANKEGLQIHLNSTHKGVKPYLCDECGQSFTGISMLSKHRLMKHKPKHLNCPHCDYKTSLQTWLKDHMRRHSSDTPFICQFCSYAAKTPGRLKVHLRIHTGERPYRCHLCDYGAMEGAPLKRHLKNQHHLLVSRIDIREGKLFMTNGDMVETGLGTRTQPLPPGSFLANNPLPESGVHEEDGMMKSEHYLSENSLRDKPVCIITQAASLSALPMQPESPGCVEERLSDYAQLLVEPSGYRLSLNSDSVVGLADTSHDICSGQSGSCPPDGD